MKKFGLFICFAIMMANTVSAQALKTYEGAMKLPSELEYLRGIFSSCYNEYNCKGSYHYYDGTDGERVKHGDFSFVSVSDGRYQHFGVTGQYKHGKMNGEWIAARLNNRGEVILPSWGKHYKSMFLINYKEGAISGRYEFIGSSDAGLYITQYTGNIVNGIIQGTVSVRKLMTDHSITDNTLADTCTMTGEVGTDGMPMGVWTVTDKGDIDKIQRRFFHNGALVAIDEMDNSTGERKLCYCAFEGLKKAPKMEEIKDSIAGMDSYIVYNGHSAIKVKDDNLKYNSNLGRYSLGNNRINVVVPEEIKQLSKSVNKQTEMWNYVYSEIKVKEIKEKERKRFIQDSIDNRERMVRRANMDIDAELQRYMDSTPKKTIKKSSMEGSDVVFKTKSEVFRGEFNKEYMLNSMGEVYQVENIYQKYNVLANKTGDIVLIKFIKRDLKTDRSVNVVYLVDKRASEVEVYEVMPSALNGLPLKW